MESMEITKAGAVAGTIVPPGDKSLSHRVLILSAIADGVSTITNFLPSEDCLCTERALRQMGVRIERLAATVRRVHGVGVHGLQRPQTDVWMGNSGTSMRLLAGVLAAQDFKSLLKGDESLQKRPMKRIILPLTMMGAEISPGNKEGNPPLSISGRPLRGVHYTSPVASAQVKSCLLLAGLYAEGKTSVTEPAASRDHTERILPAYGVTVEVEGNSVTIHPAKSLRPIDVELPGDISSASHFIVLATLFPGAELKMRNVGVNPTRTGVLDVLERMGARIEVDTSPYRPHPLGEPRGDLIVRSATLSATTIAGDEIPRCIDELPILALAASLARGTTVIKNAQELRVKECDRIKALAVNLGKMGVAVEEREDGLIIEGRDGLTPATVDSFGDHRIAMTFVIAGLLAEGGTTSVTNTACIRTSFPGFGEIVSRFR
jgi:3-phosphoshikimate 1-carboxyvinyltransferase